MGLKPPLPPSFDVSRIEALRDLWANAGLEAVETREITVLRTFADFDDFWTTTRTTPGVNSMIAAMASDDAERLKARLRGRLPADADGRITYAASANAVKGRVPV